MAFSVTRIYKRYERFALPFMLLAGLAVDVLTFQTLNLRTALSLISVHLFVAVCSMTFLLLSRERTQRVSMQTLVTIARIVQQFSFGALLSASLVFYWFSGSFSVSWPIITTIALLLMSNDVFRTYYLRPVVQLTVFFFLIFSTSTLMLPFLLRSIAPWVFILGGILSLILFGAYVAGISYVRPALSLYKLRSLAPAFVVFIVMNAFYFFNIIPPIPLSLREAGVYHDLVRIGAEYRLKKEPESFFNRLFPGTVVHVVPGTRVYVFTAIFAPQDFQETFVHRWQYFDETNGWVDRSMASFSVIGGRREGYRGYSFITNPSQGRWRVSVETARGRVLQRVVFRVESVMIPPELEQVIR